MEYEYEIDARGFVDNWKITHETGIVSANTILFMAGFHQYQKYELYDEDGEERLKVVDLNESTSFKIK